MRFNKEQIWGSIAILVFLALISVPYLIAQPADADLRFGGFLVNPIDGHSYLAKMRQGYEGSWLFTLPYSSEPGDGTAINLYYLFLGHIARVIGSPLIAVFHAARVIGALLIALSLIRFFRRALPTANQRIAGLMLALFGSGLGWLAFSLGFFSGDFWVAEAFPFLASFTNAHFPIGMALQVWLLTPNNPSGDSKLWILLLGAILLSVVYPFGWGTTAVVMLGWVTWLFLTRQEWRKEGIRALAVITGGLPFAAYTLFIVNTHPVLAQWNAQNQTPAPSALDLLISLSPAILLSIAAIFSFRQQSAPFGFLTGWLVLGAAVLYVPANLQRRLISGLYIPAASLAVWLIANKIKTIRWRRLAFLALLALSLPTNMLIVIVGLQAVRAGDEAMTVRQAELDAYAWLDEHADKALVLAAPASGLRLPAYSSVRVVYGHPFETTNALENKAEVEDFFSGASPSESARIIDELRIDYVFYGPRETGSSLEILDTWSLLYEADGVKIWSTWQR